MSDEPKKVARYASAFSILLLACFALSLLYGAVYVKDNPTVYQIFVGVSSSLLASVAVILAHSLLAERHYLRVIRSTLLQDAERTIRGLKEDHKESLLQVTRQTVAKLEELEKSYFHEISSHFREYVPADYFPPTDVPDRRFNIALNAALASSHQYFFKGVTGRHIPLRIEAMRPQSLICKVLLVDPSRDDLLWIYAKSRFSDLADRGKLIRQVRREIYMSVVGMFDIAKLSPIEIKMHHGPVFYRTEIFDEKVFVSEFTSNLRTAYPITYVYDKGTFKYDAYLKDFVDSLELQSPSVTFDANSTVDDLFAFLKAIGYRSKDLGILRQEAHELKRVFCKNSLPAIIPSLKSSRRAS